MIRFPKIYRVFTEPHFLRVNYLLTILSLSVLLIVIIIIGFDLLKNVGQKVQLDRQRQEIISQINYWKEITNKYKGYRDGYFQLAVLEYRLNDKEKAKEYLQNALEIDSNFQKGRELEKILNGK